jgi:hypothetical protein
MLEHKFDSTAETARSPAMTIFTRSWGNVEVHGHRRLVRIGVICSAAHLGQVSPLCASSAGSHRGTRLSACEGDKRLVEESVDAGVEAGALVVDLYRVLDRACAFLVTYRTFLVADSKILLG